MGLFRAGFMARRGRRIDPMSRPIAIRLWTGNGHKSLQPSQFPVLLDAASELPIWSFARLRGFVIRSPVANRFRLFLGSSAVEHSTVNRMVAGSNPARGASNFQMLQDCSAHFA